MLRLKRDEAHKTVASPEFVAEVLDGYTSYCDKVRLRLGDLTLPELLNTLRSELSQKQALGDYYQHPSIFHKGSDTFVRRALGNLTASSFADRIPFFDWDFAVRRYTELHGRDLTAHAGYYGTDCVLQDVLERVRAGLSQGDSAILDLDYDAGSRVVLQQLRAGPPCLGGSSQVPSTVPAESGRRSEACPLAVQVLSGEAVALNVPGNSTVAG